MAKKGYTREFKLKVVQAVESRELRPAQACREYQIAERVLKGAALERAFEATSRSCRSSPQALNTQEPIHYPHLCQRPCKTFRVAIRELLPPGLLDYRE